MTAEQTTAGAPAWNRRHRATDTDVFVPPENVYEALVNVAAEVRPVAKGREASGGDRYKFRGIDDVMNAVHESMARNGVLPIPTDPPGGITFEPVARGQHGKVWRHYSVRTLWTFHGPNGTTLQTEVVSEALNNEDKGLGIARSYGLKDLILRTLTLPTDDPAQDPEANTIPEQSEPNPDEQARAAGFATEAERKSLHDEVKDLRLSIPADKREPLDDLWKSFGLTPAGRPRWPLNRAELAKMRAKAIEVASEFIHDTPPDEVEAPDEPPPITADVPRETGAQMPQGDSGATDPHAAAPETQSEAQGAESGEPDATPDRQTVVLPADAILGMSKREVVEHLTALGLSTAGNLTALQDRLAEHSVEP